MTRDQAIAHLELHGVLLVTANTGFTFGLVPDAWRGDKLLHSSILDNGPWSRSIIRHPLVWRHVEWDRVSNDMLATLTLEDVAWLLEP